MTAPVLEVTGLSRRFGGVVAIDDLHLSVARGEVLGVIGPNGAGKSTLVGLVCGALPASGGSVNLGGQDVTGLDAAHRARLGVGRTHQIPRPFDRMTVLENLLLAAGTVPKGRGVRQRERDCRDILGRTGLADQAQTRAGGLTLLRRKRLELARALALSPRLLMLDEIGAGLVESETAELIELIGQLRHECDAVLVIEHVMDVITTCCDRTAVLDFGKLIALGPTRTVLADPTVAAVYLGTASEKHRNADVDADVVADVAVDAAVDGAADATSTEEPAATRTPLRLEPRVVEPLVTTTPATGATDSAEPLLRVAGVSHSYGGLRALRDVDLTVGRGEVVALLGANGAGKTTLTRVVAGVLRAESGTVSFDGHDTTGLRADHVTALGLAQCLEGRRIFGTLSVEENLVLGAGRATASERADRLDSVYTIFPALAERRSRSGTAMSGGQQQMLAIARALMSAPKLVMLDEVSLGLAPIAVDRLYEALEVIAQSGVSMVLVEQNIGRGLALASRAYVLSQGRVALSGSTSDIAADPALRALYVGDTADA